MVIICGEGGGTISKGGAIWKGSGSQGLLSPPVAVVVVAVLFYLLFFLQVIEII